MKEIPTFATWQGHTNVLDWLCEPSVPYRMQRLVIKACRKAYEAGRKHERLDPRVKNIPKDKRLDALLDALA